METEVVAVQPRPILIDKADGPCPYCAEWDAKKLDEDKKRRCDDCHHVIAWTKEMQGCGYASATVHHFHIEASGGKTLRMPMMRELCEECFRKDYFVAFPQAKVDPITSALI